MRYWSELGTGVGTLDGLIVEGSETNSGIKNAFILEVKCLTLKLMPVRAQSLLHYSVKRWACDGKFEKREAEVKLRSEPRECLPLETATYVTAVTSDAVLLSSSVGRQCSMSTILLFLSSMPRSPQAIFAEI